MRVGILPLAALLLGGCTMPNSKIVDVVNYCKEHGMGQLLIKDGARIIDIQCLPLESTVGENGGKAEKQ